MKTFLAKLKSSISGPQSAAQRDPFAPIHEPALTLYNVFNAEAKKRKQRESWIELEREAMFKAAAAYAQQHGLFAPTLKQVQMAENCATGHIDYASKWALGIAECMQAPPAAVPRVVRP